MWKFKGALNAVNRLQDNLPQNDTRQKYLKNDTRQKYLKEYSLKISLHQYGHKFWNFLLPSFTVKGYETVGGLNFELKPNIIVVLSMESGSSVSRCSGIQPNSHSGRDWDQDNFIFTRSTLEPSRKADITIHETRIKTHQSKEAFPSLHSQIDGAVQFWCWDKDLFLSKLATDRKEAPAGFWEPFQN